jgi:hypothetical protein
MASLLPLRGFICPPRLFTTGASIVAMLNRHYSRRSVGATPEHGPSGIQLTLDFNRDYLIGGWTKPELGANPGRCLLLVE